MIEKTSPSFIFQKFVISYLQDKSKNMIGKSAILFQLSCRSNISSLTVIEIECQNHFQTHDYYYQKFGEYQNQQHTQLELKQTGPPLKFDAIMPQIRISVSKKFSKKILTIYKKLGQLRLTYKQMNNNSHVIKINTNNPSIFLSLLMKNKDCSIIQKKIKQRMVTNPQLTPSYLSMCTLPQISLPSIRKTNQQHRQSKKHDYVINQFVFNYFRKKSRFKNSERIHTTIEKQKQRQRQRLITPQKTPSNIKYMYKAKNRRNLQFSCINNQSIDSYFNIEVSSRKQQQRPKRTRI